MRRKASRCCLGLLVLAAGPLPAAAEVMAFRVLPNASRATFKTEAPLETVVGNTSGPAITGTVTGDPADPQTATGSIKVDLSALKTGVENRDTTMRGKDFLNTEREVNRYAVLNLKSVEIAGALEPGREVPAKLRGILTIKEKPVEITAEARITYITLSPEQAEPLKRAGFTRDILRVKAQFNTSFTNHGMQIPQYYILRLSDKIQIETDLTLVRQ